MSASPATAPPVRQLVRGRHAGRPSAAARATPAVLLGVVGLVVALVLAPLAGLLVAAVGVVLAAASRRRRDVLGLVASLLGAAVAVAAWAVTGSPA